MVQSSRDTGDQNQGGSAGTQEQGSGGSMMDQLAGNVSHFANVDEQKGKAASALRDVASTLRERANSAPLPGVDAAAQAAAKPLETSAAYLEQHTPGDMWSDLMSFCRDHPAGALAIGFSTGYLFHKLFR